MAQVRHPLQRSEFLQQTNNVVISNRKIFCARQWVLCVGCPGSIEAVWSTCPCIDQEETLLAKVYPWRQHHPGLCRQGGGIFQHKEGCVEWGSLSSLCDEGTRLHNVDNVYLLTEFRQPLQVQSHLEMPRILVQLGHTQRT